MWYEVRKTLEGFEKKDLIQLIIELAKLQKDNMAWLDAKLLGQEEFPKLVEYYKEKIMSSFWELDLKLAKKGISDFKKASKDREGLIDLMIFYVEQGTEFTLKYWGDKSLIHDFRTKSIFSTD